MDSVGTLKEAMAQSFKLLDKVTEFRFALAIMSVVIAIDIALVQINNHSVLTMDWLSLGAVDVTKLGLAVVIYVFWMAALSPLVRFVVEFTLSLLGEIPVVRAFRGIFEPARESDGVRYARGHVKVEDAKTRALSDKDTFWIAQVEKAEAKGIRQRDEMSALARLSFSVAGLLLMDWWNKNSIVGEIVMWLDEFDGWMGYVVTLGVCVCVLLIVFPWIYDIRVGYSGDDWMKHPELAKERLAAIKSQRRASVLADTTGAEFT